MNKDRIEELKKKIQDLKERWPAHSVPAPMMIELDDLEAELQNELMLEKRPWVPSEMDSQVIQLQPIGHVENMFTEPASPGDICSAESRIIINPALVEGLSGLQPGQQLMVIFHFDRSDGFDLLQHPRGDQSSPKRGVFALRSPRRPNPIGVTEVQLTSIEGNILTVRGLDAINGTPVLDLKPV